MRVINEEYPISPEILYELRGIFNKKSPWKFVSPRTFLLYCY